MRFHFLARALIPDSPGNGVGIGEEESIMIRINTKGSALNLNLVGGQLLK